MNPYDILRVHAADIIAAADDRIAKADAQITAAMGDAKAEAQARVEVSTARLDRVAAYRAAAELLRDAALLEAGKAFL